MAPVKSLLDAGVLVVGETHTAGGRPNLYFDSHLDSYINRELNIHGEKMTPQEGCSSDRCLEADDYSICRVFACR